MWAQDLRSARSSGPNDAIPNPAGIGRRWTQFARLASKKYRPSFLEASQVAPRDALRDTRTRRASQFELARRLLKHDHICRNSKLEVPAFDQYGLMPMEQTEELKDELKDELQVGKERLIRLPEVLALVPVSRSTWWAGVKRGKYPQPIKLGPRLTCWRLRDVLELTEKGTR